MRPDVTPVVTISGAVISTIIRVRTNATRLAAQRARVGCVRR